jgi:LysR family glycine cleavage system transcriptional activator
LAIRFGRGGYSDGHTELLLGETLAPACAPGRFSIASVRDLQDAPLLHDDSVDVEPGNPGWAAWFSDNNGDAASARRGLRFNQAALVLEAAIAGQGVALAKTQLADLDVAAGRLVYPLGTAGRVVLSQAYYMVWPRGRTVSPAVRAFMDWLRHEAAAVGDADVGGGI